VDPFHGPAWHFLRDGALGANAIAALETLISPLGNSLNSDIHLAVNTYLAWVESAAVQLGTYMEDRAAVQQLYTERYWRIRAIDDATVRPFPLLAEEVAWQKDRLIGIRDQLRKYVAMMVVPHTGVALVCDTNVYMHGRLFPQLSWDKAAESSHALILVPLVVVDELDDIKNRGGENGKWARRVIKEMEAHAPDGSGLGPFAVRRGVTLQFLDEPRGHRRLQRPDDEIVRQAQYFSALTESEVRIVTLDRGMLLRAQSFEVSFLRLPSDFQRETEDA